MRAYDLMCLASRAVEALGVNGNTTDAAHIMEHSIGQACIELEAVEAVLERDPNSQLVYIVMGVRQRLEFAGTFAKTLAKMIAEGSEAANG